MCYRNCPKQRFQTGLALLKVGQLEQAAELAATAVCDFPDEGALWELLGVSHQRRGEYELAREALEMATLLKPLDIGARFCLAEAYAATGYRDLAVFVYRLVAEDPRTPTWLLPKVASHLGELQEFAEALAVCQRIVDRDDSRHEAHFGMGFYLRRMGMATDRVLAAISRAHELAPQIALYRVVLALLWHEQGRTDDAHELLRWLPPDAVMCPDSVKRMMLVFHSVNDVQRVLDCRQWLRKRSDPDAAD